MELTNFDKDFIRSEYQKRRDTHFQTLGEKIWWYSVLVLGGFFALYSTLHLLVYLFGLSICFEDGSCKIFHSVGEITDWYGI